MATNNNPGFIPSSTTPLADKEGKVTNPWYFWLKKLAQQSSSNVGNYVIDGSYAAYGQTTIYQGISSGMGSGSAGELYFATDTKTIYQNVGGTWHSMIPAFTGDVTNTAGSNQLLLSTVNTDVGTYDNARITVDAQGRVTAASSGLSGGSSTGIYGDVQFADGGGNFLGEDAFNYSSLSGTPTLTITGTVIPSTITDSANSVGTSGQVLSSTGTTLLWEDQLAPANPTAEVGLTVVNGTATTYMRSDAAPPIDQSIAPTWTGVHTFDANITLNSTLTDSTVSVGTSGQVLSSTGSAVQWSSNIYSQDGTASLQIPNWTGTNPVTLVGSQQSSANGGDVLIQGGQNLSGGNGGNLFLQSGNGDNFYGYVLLSAAGGDTPRQGEVFVLGEYVTLYTVNPLVVNIAGSTGTTGQVLGSDGAGNVTWVSAGGSPGGSDQEVQYNASGAFTADANFKWDYTNQVLKLVGGVASPYGQALEVAGGSSSQGGVICLSSGALSAGVTSSIYSSSQPDGSSIQIRSADGVNFGSVPKNAGEVNIQGGDADAGYANGSGGGATFVGGSGYGGANYGGGVALATGIGYSGAGSGFFQLTIGNNNAIQIKGDDNAWYVGPSELCGSAGNMLTSRGAGTAPEWSYPAPVYTLATLPTAVAGLMITVSDANSGAGALCYSDGVTWKDAGTHATVA